MGKVYRIILANHIAVRYAADDDERHINDKNISTVVSQSCEWCVPFSYLPLFPVKKGLYLFDLPQEALNERLMVAGRWSFKSHAPQGSKVLDYNFRKFERN